VARDRRAAIAAKHGVTEAALKYHFYKAQRAGAPTPKQLHAELLAPLPARLLERIRQSELVLVDETSIKMLGSTRRAYVWIFIADTLIAYWFSVDRSAETP
jgi:hypothetical protein